MRIILLCCCVRIFVVTFCSVNFKCNFNFDLQCINVHYRLYIPLPNEAGRRQLIERLLGMQLLFVRDEHVSHSCQKRMMK